jgi:hypothetical protein
MTTQNDDENREDEEVEESDDDIINKPFNDTSRNLTNIHELNL